MRRTLLVGVAALAAAAASVGLPAAGSATASSARLVVHEWGTFTSVAGQAGVSLDWRPLDGETSDLPSFVYTLADVARGTRFPGGLTERERGKAGREGTVRMETPVVYFYSQVERRVALSVRFPGGTITEWYPRARAVTGDGIDWGVFTLQPEARPTLPVEHAASHYYPARAVDATPVRVGARAGVEHEKFLFYRGVGSLALPLAARVDGQRVVVRASAEVGTVVLYERQGRRVGWRTIQLAGGAEATLERPALATRALATPPLELYAQLGALLTRHGLFDAEARAMLDTWRSTWFEDGLRVFYLLPTAATAAALPMTIDPPPDELVRVLVGRVELISPEVEQAAHAMLDAVDPGCPDSIATARAALQARHGRFTRAVLVELMRGTHDRATARRVAAVLASDEVM